MSDDSGGFVGVPADYVAASLELRPNAITIPTDIAKAIIELPQVGKVRFTCRKYTYWRRRSR